ncbi:unnamed protein product, partial [Heligmosomoides polygyrus]|uniref:Sideroflexin 3 n=1 Tax=Heligmosomoides polygyrus TaxID=6339 RepID=A0A183F2V3_HELPZ
RTLAYSSLTHRCHDSGRARHFFTTANPLNVLLSNDVLEKSRKIVVDYRNGIYDKDLTVDQLWHAKHIYDSAFHPDTGEKMFILGRMSAQVCFNKCLYIMTSHVVFFQWINQTFNAVVNYTNRSGPNPVERLLTSYTFATSGAMAAALGGNYILSKMKVTHFFLIPYNLGKGSQSCTLE